MGLFCASPLPGGHQEKVVSIWEEPWPSPMSLSGSASWNGCAILKAERRGFQRERRRPRLEVSPGDRHRALFPPSEGNKLKPTSLAASLEWKPSPISAPYSFLHPILSSVLAGQRQEGLAPCTCSFPHHTGSLTHPFLHYPLVPAPSRGPGPSACTEQPWLSVDKFESWTSFS